MKVLIFADLEGKRHDTCKLQVCTPFSDHSEVHRPSQSFYFFQKVIDYLILHLLPVNYKFCIATAR